MVWRTLLWERLGDIAVRRVLSLGAIGASESTMVGGTGIEPVTPAV
jgi:hypothetical protein